MYNGIGLVTPRGSGTSGYVQRNLSFVREDRKERQKEYMKPRDMKPPAPKKANLEILEHERKRQLEIKLLKFRDAMEDKNYSETEIEEKISEIRKKLTAQMEQEKRSGDGSKSIRGETHREAQAKEVENENIKSALGISSEYKAGQAFDRELQEQKRQERLERIQREQDDRDREEQQKIKDEMRREMEKERREKEIADEAERVNRKREREEKDKEGKGAEAELEEKADRSGSEEKEKKHKKHKKHKKKKKHADSP